MAKTPVPAVQIQPYTPVDLSQYMQTPRPDYSQLFGALQNVGAPGGYENYANTFAGMLQLPGVTPQQPTTQQSAPQQASWSDLIYGGPLGQLPWAQR